MRDDLKKLDAAIEAELSSGLPAAMGLPDWTYRDLPRLAPEFMRQFKEVVGEENLKWITYADYGTSQRGQVLISPEGVDRIRAFNDKVQVEK